MPPKQQTAKRSLSTPAGNLRPRKQARAIETDSEGTSSVEAQKRGPGRPRRTRSTSRASDEYENEDETSQVGSGGEESPVRESMTPMPRRPRGRPRRSSKGQRAQVEEAERVSGDDSEGPPRPANIPEKRRPGRPRGSVDKPKDSAPEWAKKMTDAFRAKHYLENTRQRMQRQLKQGAKKPASRSELDYILGATEVQFDSFWTPELDEELLQEWDQSAEKAAFEDLKDLNLHGEVRILWKISIRIFRASPFRILSPFHRLLHQPNPTSSTSTDPLPIIWQQGFCKHFSRLLTHPLFRGEVEILAVFLQYAVICRTGDVRRWVMPKMKLCVALDRLRKKLGGSKAPYESSIHAMHVEVRKDVKRQGFLPSLVSDVLRYLGDVVKPGGLAPAQTTVRGHMVYCVTELDLDNVRRAIDNYSDSGLFNTLSSTEVAYQAHLTARGTPGVPANAELHEYHERAWLYDQRCFRHAILVEEAKQVQAAGVSKAAEPADAAQVAETTDAAQPADSSNGQPIRAWMFEDWDDGIIEVIDGSSDEELLSGDVSGADMPKTEDMNEDTFGPDDSGLTSLPMGHSLGPVWDRDDHLLGDEEPGGNELGVRGTEDSQECQPGLPQVSSVKEGARGIQSSPYMSLEQEIENVLCEAQKRLERGRASHVVDEQDIIDDLSSKPAWSPTLEAERQEPSQVGTLATQGETGHEKSAISSTGRAKSPASSSACPQSPTGTGSRGRSPESFDGSQALSQLRRLENRRLRRSNRQSR